MMKTTMKALVLRSIAEQQFQIEEVPRPELKTGQVLIQVQAAALNHRDQYIREGLYEGIQLPCILGSDACGLVEAVEKPADNHWVGQEVTFNPGSNWGDNPKAQSRHFATLGMPAPGVFAEYVAVDADRLHRKPTHLQPEQASTLPVGGATAYRAAITQGTVSPDMTVLVTGIGGGVAQFALQFAHALGASVYATSGSDWKLDRVMEMGVAGGGQLSYAKMGTKVKERERRRIRPDY